MSDMQESAKGFASHSSAVGNPWLVVMTLCRRELVRFFRQRNRVIGALVQPLLFWILLAAGFGNSVRLPTSDANVSYGEFFFPGTLAMIVLFTAIFATISIIEDRREGFLQSVLVAPIPRWAMVLGKILGGTLIALMQAGLFLVLGLWLGVEYSVVSLVLILVLLFVMGLSLTGLGFAIAWRMDSTQGFHAIMSVFLLPMWLLSGAFFPAASGVLAWVMWINPLSYGVAGLRHLLYWNDPLAAAALPPQMPGMTACWVVTILFAAVTFALSCELARHRTTGDLL